MNEMEQLVRECKEGIDSIMLSNIEGLQLVSESIGECNGMNRHDFDTLQKEIKTLKGLVIGLSAITTGGAIYLAIKEYRKKKNARKNDQE